MGENSTTALKIAIGVIMTCILISMALYLVRQGQAAGNGVGQSLAAVTTAISNQDITNYTSDEVAGSDVLNFVRKNSSNIDCFVITRTAATPEGTPNWNGICLPNLNSVSHTGYVCVAWNNSPLESLGGQPGITLDGVKFVINDTSNYRWDSTLNTFFAVCPSLTDNDPRNTTTYINPMCSYQGFTIKNDNSVVSIVYFVQTSDVQVASIPGISDGGVNPGGGGGANPGGGYSGGMSDASAQQIVDTMNNISNVLVGLQNSVDTFNGNAGSMTGPDLSNIEITLSSDDRNLLNSLYVAMNGSADGTPGLISSYNNLATGLTDISQQVATLQDSTTALTTEVRNSETVDLSSVESNLASCVTQLSMLSGDISGISSAIGDSNGGLVKDVHNIQSTINAVSSNMSREQRAIDDLAIAANSLSAMYEAMINSNKSVVSSNFATQQAVTEMQNQVASMRTTLGKVVSGNSPGTIFTGMTSDIDSLQAEIDKIENLLGAITTLNEGDPDTVGALLVALGTKIGNLESQLTQLNAKVDSLDNTGSGNTGVTANDVNALRTGLTGLNTVNGEMQSAVDDLLAALEGNNSEEANNLRAQLNEIKTQLTGSATTIGTLQGVIGNE